MEKWIAELEQNLDSINQQIVALGNMAERNQPPLELHSMQYLNGELALAPLLLAKANTVHALVDAYVWQANNKAPEPLKLEEPLTEAQWAERHG